VPLSPLPPPLLLAPGVSVVIPVKDDAAALERCLDALAHQTTLPAEVIVVDNGSSDDSGAVAERWGARLLHEREPGIPAAASKGYSAARHAVIARLDADSVPPPGWVAAGLAALAEHPEAAAVTGPGSFYDGPRHGSRLIAAAYLGAYFRSIRLAVGAVPLFGSTFFLRTAVWHEVAWSVHRWGTTLHDDLDLTIHLTPGHLIRLDRAVAVGISFRPFTQWRTLGFRFYRGFVTLALHWPADSALLRIRRRLHGRARRVVAALR
jgi:glycosyltransferase involved in cell wall biosynthesis